MFITWDFYMGLNQYNIYVKHYIAIFPCVIILAGTIKALLRKD